MRSATGGHWGLALLLREGVAAWILRRSSSDVPVVRPREGSMPMSAPMSDEMQASLVRTLASMALAGREEMRL